MLLPEFEKLLSFLCCEWWLKEKCKMSLRYLQLQLTWFSTILEDTFLMNYFPPKPSIPVIFQANNRCVLGIKKWQSYTRMLTDCILENKASSVGGRLYVSPHEFKCLFLLQSHIVPPTLVADSSLCVCVGGGASCIKVHVMKKVGVWTNTWAAHSQC